MMLRIAASLALTVIAARIDMAVPMVSVTPAQRTWAKSLSRGVATVRRLFTTFAVALCLAGCGTTVPSGEPVALLTGAMPFDEEECSNRDLAAQLLVDPKYGTTLAGYPDIRTPVMWRPGFTGRRAGSEVVVVDSNGQVIATTGESYRILGAMLFRTREPLDEFEGGQVFSPIGVDLFYACDLVGPWATQPAPGTQCGSSFPCPGRP
jgi:hypothetical protein